MTELKIGDVVRLVSGGPWMTVAVIEPMAGYANVIWFSADHSGCHRSDMRIETLVKVSPEKLVEAPKS